tara:strand:- start:536 stop:763 length:228 start_codon:yes stop_codon:yes gene_type:complete
MKLAEFKAQHGISQLNFYKSKTSSRMVAAHGDIMLVTTETFDPKGELMVYDNPNAIDGKGYILSNTVQKEAVFVL